MSAHTPRLARCLPGLVSEPGEGASSLGMSALPLVLDSEGVTAAGEGQPKLRAGIPTFPRMFYAFLWDADRKVAWLFNLPEVTDSN